VNILHYLSGLDPSGASRSGALLAAGLRAHGHACRVAAGGGGPLRRDLEGAGVPVRLLPPRAGFFDFERRRAFADALSHPPADLLHLNNLSLEGPALARRARREGIPVVWHVREDPDSSRFRRLRGPLLKLADRVIAVSAQIGRRLEDGARPGQISILHNGIDPGPAPDPGGARRESGLDPGDFWVGWIGRVVERKGALDFLRALAEMPDAPAARGRGRVLKLVLAGRPGDGARERRYWEEIERFLAERPGLRSRTLLVAEPERLPRLAEALDLLVVPSYWEGCSRVILEGMRAGRPIAAYASGGTPEIVADGDSGLLVPVGDVEALRRAVQRVADEPELARRLGAEARRQVETRLTLARHVDAVEKLFSEIAARGRGRPRPVSDPRPPGPETGAA
jgi:glycosyltransferase involved in cell wall biosynthesis